MKGLLLTAALLAGGSSAQELETLSGEVFSLASLLERAPAVLVFWNSWLPRGQEFLPLVREIEKAAAEQGWPGVVVVFQEDDPQATARLGRGAFPRVVDRRGTLVRQFHVTRAPVVVLVQPTGEVTARAGPEAAAVRELFRSTAER